MKRRNQKYPVTDQKQGIDIQKRSRKNSDTKKTSRRKDTRSRTSVKKSLRNIE